jgi:hypothetical protein
MPRTIRRVCCELVRALASKMQISYICIFVYLFCGLESTKQIDEANGIWGRNDCSYGETLIEICHLPFANCQIR